MLVAADVERQRKGALYGGPVGPAGVAFAPVVNTYGRHRTQQQGGGGGGGGGGGMGAAWGDSGQPGGAGGGMRQYSRSIVFVASHTLNDPSPPHGSGAVVLPPSGKRPPSDATEAAAGTAEAAPEPTPEAATGEGGSGAVLPGGSRLFVEPMSLVGGEEEEEDNEEEVGGGRHAGLGSYPEAASSALWQAEGWGGAGLGFVPPAVASEEEEEEEEGEDVYDEDEGEEEEEEDGLEEDGLEEEEEVGLELEEEGGVLPTLVHDDSGTMEEGEEEEGVAEQLRSRREEPETGQEGPLGLGFVQNR